MDHPDTDTSFIEEFRSRSASLALSRTFSPRESEMLYAMAYQLVVQGNHEKAFSLFTLLVLSNPTNAKYLRGLALLNRHLERYREALMLLRFIDALDPGNPQNTMDVAETLLQLKEFERARRVLEETIARCQSVSAAGAMLEKATALRDLIATRGGDAAGA